MKRFLYYVTCTVVIGIMLYMGTKYQIHLKEESTQTFELMPFIIFTALFPIVIGMLLRLPKLMIEIKEKKTWTFDWIKIVAIGLPSLYVALIPIFAFSSFGSNFPLANNIVLFGDKAITTIAGLIFGYVLLDSLKEE